MHGYQLEGSIDGATHMWVPACPTCGADTRVGTPGTGKLKGKRFWFCVEEPERHSPIPLSSRRTTMDVRPVKARALRDGHRVQFFDHLYLTRDLLAQRLDDREQEMRRQWRCEYPDAVLRFQADELQCRVLSVALKLVCRGPVSILPEHLEKMLSSRPSGQESSCRGPTSFGRFDSVSEKRFYWDLLPDLLGPGWRRWVTPQIENESLTEDPAFVDTDQRVDFLVSHPLLSSPVVIEIDGPDHDRKADQTRDNALRHAGYLVVRVPADSVWDRRGDELDNLSSLFRHVREEERGAAQADPIRAAGQMQVTILLALTEGIVDFSAGVAAIGSDLVDRRGMTWGQFKAVIYDLSHLLSQVASLYGLEDCLRLEPVAEETELDLFLSFGGADTNCPTLHIEDAYLPFRPSRPRLNCTPGRAVNTDSDLLGYFLRRVFGFEEFREGQEEAVRRTLEGNDSIVLLPTGAGKSLVFQLAGLLLPGVTIVVAPIISLIHDQVSNLAKAGLGYVLGMTSDVAGPDERALAYEHLRRAEECFYYVSPERFQIPKFRSAVWGLKRHTSVSLLAIDEAHCVSEWGHDFRTSYLRLGASSREVCASPGWAPPMLALTGTASHTVLRDVQRDLEIREREALVTPETFDRSELKFEIRHCRSGSKAPELTEFLAEDLPDMLGAEFDELFPEHGLAEQGGLVFCPHVNGDFGIDHVAESLSSSLAKAGNRSHPLHIPMYGGKVPKSFPAASPRGGSTSETHSLGSNRTRSR